MSYTDIIFEHKDKIAFITLNRPNSMNSFGTKITSELSELVNKLKYNKDFRVLVITGAGEKAFSAGADLKERKSMTTEEKWQHSRQIALLFDEIEKLPIPVIAAINGFALGAGFELALASDIRLASNNAVLGFPEVAVGVFPAAGGVRRLPQYVGKGRAKELILTGRKLQAEEALNLGLIDRIIPPESLMAEAIKLAEQIAEYAPMAVGVTKEFINMNMNSNFITGEGYESKAVKMIFASRDYTEGITAFQEKRKPEFKGE